MLEMPKQVHFLTLSNHKNPFQAAAEDAMTYVVSVGTKTRFLQSHGWKGLLFQPLLVQALDAFFRRIV